MQTSNPKDSDNYSVFVVNHYPKTAGTEWKADTNRISPHTDETLVTLLFTSPGEQKSEPCQSWLLDSLIDCVPPCVHCQGWWAVSDEAAW